MGRQRQRKMEQREADNSRPPRYYPPSQGGQGLAIATLITVVGVLMVSFANWREIDRIEENLNTKFGEMETRITQVATKVDNIPKQPAAQPARRGPDPNRVYAINTNGAPSKGPSNAPVTIAEFSDFQ